MKRSPKTNRGATKEVLLYIRATIKLLPSPTLYGDRSIGEWGRKNCFHGAVGGSSWEAALSSGARRKPFFLLFADGVITIVQTNCHDPSLGRRKSLFLPFADGAITIRIATIRVQFSKEAAPHSPTERSP
ncbi:hypothetical protein B0H10DRAFT_2198819 [Mycena sp. CBHHK59/15]|nr:hypothetical protein B0H10DRAFT_2198819 [Mycena sp. CBHHK59/15]